MRQPHDSAIGPIGALITRPMHIQKTLLNYIDQGWASKKENWSCCPGNMGNSLTTRNSRLLTTAPSSNFWTCGSFSCSEQQASHAPPVYTLSSELTSPRLAYACRWCHRRQVAPCGELPVRTPSARSLHHCPLKQPHAFFLPPTHPYTPKALWSHRGECLGRF